MNETQIKELRAHAGKLVAEGKSLSGVFLKMHGNQWYAWLEPNTVPDFTDGKQWRIAKPKKQLIDWSHPYFKGCATNYGTLEVYGVNCAFTSRCDWVHFKELRLATPANDDSNWQYFRSTPENNAKLRELAEMVKVEVRYFSRTMQIYTTAKWSDVPTVFEEICNYRITGLQDGWTDNPEETTPC